MLENWLHLRIHLYKEQCNYISKDFLAVGLCNWKNGWYNILLKAVSDNILLKSIKQFEKIEIKCFKYSGMWKFGTTFEQDEDYFIFILLILLNYTFFPI